MSRLVLTNAAGERKTFPVTERGVTIGRQLDNTIVLGDPIVSRRHALVELRGRETWIRDLNSRNGVFVNRLRVREELLNDGAVVQIGPFELHFEERAAQSVVLDDNRYYPLASEGRAVQSVELPEGALDLREFYRISTRLNQIIGLRDLLAAVVDEAMKIVPAHRCVLMLRKGKELVPMVVIPSDQSEVPVARSIVRKALELGEAVLTRDARLDFGTTESIISASVRSAICVPLLSQGNALGVLLVDSPGRERFGQRDRDILAALAMQAAVMIERAQLMETLRTQEQTRQLLGRFLSPNVSSAIERYFSQHGMLWEAQELNVTILFSDVKGFSSLSERLTPREVQDLLNEYFHEMTDVVFKYEGTLDKYIGDAIMAVFGAPRLPDEPANDQHAQQAVSAALEMLEAHRRLVDKLEPHKHFQIRIGVNTGLAYTGFFGTKQRLEYTAIGDAVNTAQRLEGRAEPNSVFIGEQTRVLLNADFVLEDVGDLDLKGKQQVVRAYKVIGARH